MIFGDICSVFAYTSIKSAPVCVLMPLPRRTDVVCGKERTPCHQEIANEQKGIWFRLEQLGQGRVLHRSRSQTGRNESRPYQSASENEGT